MIARSAGSESEGKQGVLMEDSLECHRCGKRIRYLGDAEELAWNPYNFVAYCQECVKEHHSLLDIFGSVRHTR